MAKKKKSGGGGGDDGANDWLNTYADMVTLLMCFFVLLYSMSSIDSEKWALIVQAFNKDAIIEDEIRSSQVGTEDIDTSGDQLLTNEEAFDNLYWQLQQFVESNRLNETVSVERGDGYTFIVFRNNIFFEGNSYALSDGAKEILGFLADGLSSIEANIAEVRVLGHTTQVTEDEMGDVSFDRHLSSSRAAEVAVFLQQNSLLSPDKLVSQGYGQYHPISPIDTEENRAENRRVEILITEDSSVGVTLGEVYEDIGYEGGGEN